MLKAILLGSLLLPVTTTGARGFAEQPTSGSCGDATGTLTKGGGNPPLSLPEEMDTCTYLATQGFYYADAGQGKKGLDTLKLYIERCAMKPGAWEMFSSAARALTDIPVVGDSLVRIYTEHREWLKKVLYYNTIDSNYYCADVSSMLATFQYNEKRGQVDMAGLIAVCKYILESGKCPLYEYDFRESYTNGRFAQYQHWIDSVDDRKDDPRYALDTTLPSLEELDLEILRGPNAGGVKGKGDQASLLSQVRVSPNPFKIESELSFTLPASELITFEVFDELGRVVQEAKRTLYLEGSHTFTISGEGLASGSYYARLTTGRGETRTLRVVKQ
jgi:hypothetical protein